MSVRITREELAETTRRLAREIGAAYPDGVVLVAVLKGSVFFLADLVRSIDVPCEVDFMAISHFAHGSGRVRIVKDLEVPIGGRDVVVVEDIVDTGLTLGYLLEQLRLRLPASLAVCTLLDRSPSRILPLQLAFVGFTVDRAFLIGYGLDFQERYRNVAELHAVPLPVLARRPDAYVATLFGKGRDGST